MLVAVSLLLILAIYGVGGIHRLIGMPPQFTKNGQPRKDVMVLPFYTPFNLILPCEVAGIPTPLVTWYREGVVIDQRYVSADGTLSLRLEESELSVKGTQYYCTATNNIGRDSAEATLRSRNVNVTLAVFNGFRALHKRIVQIQTLLGGDVALECDFIPGKIVPRVEWRTTLGYVVNEVREFNSIRYLDGGRVLLMRKLSKAQRSVGYYCVVTNFPDSNNFIHRSPITYYIGEDIPPLGFVLYTELGTREARVGEKLEIGFAANHADAEGQPRLVGLFCDGGGLVTLSSIDVVILEAVLNENARTATEVVYTCLVSSNQKVLTGTIIVLKDESPLITDPIFQNYQLDRERRIGYGLSVLYNCVTASDEPLSSITWYHNGLVIQSGADGIILHENGSLTIQYPTLSHFGVYQCIAVNDLRDDIRLWLLEVRSEEHIVPIKYNYTYFSANQVSLGSKKGDLRPCPNEHTSFTCDDPTTTVLFDGLRPNLVRLFGRDRTVNDLHVLRSNVVNMTLEFNMTSGIRRVEMELMDCETSGISMEAITMVAGDKQIISHPSSSCSKLVKVCMPIIPAITSNVMTIKFTSRQSSDWMAISNINFYTEIDSCKIPLNSDVFIETVGDPRTTPPQVVSHAPDCTIATIASTIPNPLGNGPASNVKDELVTISDASKSTQHESNLAVIASIFSFIGGIFVLLIIELVIWKASNVEQVRTMAEGLCFWKKWTDNQSP